MTKLRIAYVLANIAVVSLIVTSCKLALDLDRSERLEAVGGVETYRAQRVAHLLALKDKLSISDPEVRERELTAIDRQIDEIENEVTDELGDEVRRVK